MDNNDDNNETNIGELYIYMCFQLVILVRVHCSNVCCLYGGNNERQNSEWVSYV